MIHLYSNCGTTNVFNNVSMTSFMRVLNVRKIHPTIRLPLTTTFAHAYRIPHWVQNWFPDLLQISQSLKIQTYLRWITCCYLLPRYIFGLMQFGDVGVSERVVFSDCHILLSPAKEPRLAFCVFLSMSIISIRSNSGPRTDLWRTHDKTHTQSDKWPFNSLLRLFKEGFQALKGFFLWRKVL